MEENLIDSDDTKKLVTIELEMNTTKLGKKIDLIGHNDLLFLTTAIKSRRK
jgi:hypothetical protein